MGYYKYIPRGTAGGWEKMKGKAHIGGTLGTVFDNSVIKEGDIYKMWYSWRPVCGIAYATSRDGIEWTLPQMVMTKQKDLWWARDEVNRPCVIYKDGTYHMWFIGMVRVHDFETGFSAMGYATSQDGLHWDIRKEPVMSAELPWEKSTLYCPHVIWDQEQRMYKMWYSGGEQYECDAIGYATSADGIHWKKYGGNPIFTPDPDNFWDMSKVEACYVIEHDDYFYMFYLGFSADRSPSIGLARSKDGITHWERHPDNPIIAGTDGMWDWLGICKPTVMKTDDGFLMWYNGVNRSGDNGSIKEEMGLAIHKGHNLWPEPDAERERDIPEQEIIYNELFLGT